MGQVMFYHLTHSPIEATVPLILGKSLQAGWRVLVRGRDAALLQRLDLTLWRDPSDGFLPHGLAGGPHDADQPVLLTTDPAPAAAAPNLPACLVAIDGAAVTPDEAAALERVCILFDGADPAAVDHARGQWRALTGAGLPAQYWSEASGAWRKERG